MYISPADMGGRRRAREVQVEGGGRPEGHVLVALQLREVSALRAEALDDCVTGRGGLAQMVERESEKLEVGGSSPPPPTTCPRWWLFWRRHTWGKWQLLYEWEPGKAETATPSDWQERRCAVCNKRERWRV